MPEVSERIAIESRIEVYLEGRQSYFQRMYGERFVAQMTKSERRMLKAALECGDLDDWQEGVDPITHVSSRVEKRELGTEDTVRVTTHLGNQFSAEIQTLLRRSGEPESGIVSVGMNESGTVKSPHTSQQSSEILSIGMGGCIQVVIASNDDHKTSISLFHFDPTQWTRLCDAIKQRANEHREVKKEAIIFVEANQNTAIFEMTIKNVMPECSVRVEKMNLLFQSEHPDEDIIRARSVSDGSVSINLKGQSFRILFEGE